MLKYVGVIAVVLSSLAVMSCDNEIDLVEFGEDIPVVYGLLGVSDTAHYIRVERSFIDETTSALVLADDPDNFFYEDLQVLMTNEATGTTVELTRVDGNEDGYPREDGVFAESPNFLYKVVADDFALASEEDISLDVRLSDESIATATTVVIENATLIKPAVNRPSSQFNAANPAGIEVQFRHPQDDLVFDVTIVLTVSESGLTKEVTIPVAQGTTEDNFDYPLESFYSQVRSAFIDGPAVSRRLISARFELTASGEELSDFLRVKTANLGITSSQEPPRFTNIEGGFGVFSSRSKLTTRELAPTTLTLDSLANGVFTRGLGFTF
jgi:hypothetical protein